MIASDDPVGLELPDTLEHGRGREPHVTSDGRVGYARVGLEELEDAPVDIVEHVLEGC